MLFRNFPKISSEVQKILNFETINFFPVKIRFFSINTSKRCKESEKNYKIALEEKTDLNLHLPILTKNSAKILETDFLAFKDIKEHNLKAIKTNFEERESTKGIYLTLNYHINHNLSLM